MPRSLQTLAWTVLLLHFAVGCSGGIVAPDDDDSGGEVDDDDSDADDDGDDDDSGATDDDDSSGDDDDTTGEVFDCATIPGPPFDRSPLAAPRGYNDLVFDAAGAMIGNDTSVLVRATSPEDWDVYAAGVGTIYKMGYLPSGDIVATTAARSIIKINPDGIRTVLVADFDGYGLAIGSGGMVYAGTDYTTDAPEIIRVDPSTGEFTQFIDAAQYAPRGLEFSHDYSVLYFGTTNDGRVFRVELDENLDPVSDPQPLVNMPVSWHDTLEVDACGNLYVGSFFGHQIMRVDATLSITQLLDWNFDNYGHGFEWGSAVGGWDETSIYMTHPYNGSWVDEIQIGVPGRQWTGEVLGRVVL